MTQDKDPDSFSIKLGPLTVEAKANGRFAIIVQVGVLAVLVAIFVTGRVAHLW